MATGQNLPLEQRKYGEELQMPKVGDRVIVAGTKLGNPTREGTLIGLVGPLINVRWSDGSVSLFKPGAGSVSFESGNGHGAGGSTASTPARARGGTLGRAGAKPKAKQSAVKAKAAASKKKPRAQAKAKPSAAKKVTSKKKPAPKKR